MHLDAYLYRSRHSIFYFRWPLPKAPDSANRASIRLSLGTRCPKLAGQLARHLASCGDVLRHSKALSNMRHDELRGLIHQFFKKALLRQTDKLNANGPMSELELAPVETAQRLAEASDEDFWDILHPNGAEAFLSQFCEASGIPQSEAIENPARVQREYKLAYRDMLRAWETNRVLLENYDYAERETRAPLASEITITASSSLTLQQAIDEYTYEAKRAGTTRAATLAKKVTNLGMLTELFGPDRLLASLTKQDAQHAKRTLLELPANRNKMPTTRGLTLLDAVKVQGVAKVTAVTIDGYISTFQTFFDWAEKNGHASTNLFKGMRVGKSNSRGAPKRKAFDQDALQAVYLEITENSLGLVRMDSHKWATLIAMFSGARLNEVCQMELADIQVENGIWFFNLLDEGDTNKRFKSGAALRKVPIHNELLRLGLLDYHATMAEQHGTRLFPDYSYCIKNGYGRSLSRWFNGTLTRALGIKSKHHVFHGLRHTMVTRLAQADIEEPIYQSIVGHERKGVTQQVYNRQGYTLAQLKTAIDKFAV